jgi:hypothetical protein
MIEVISSAFHLAVNFAVQFSACFHVRVVHPFLMLQMNETPAYVHVSSVVI